MKSKYHHLSLTERVKIEVLLDHGVVAARIAAFLGRSRSTVSREVQRAHSFGPTLRYVAHFGTLFYQHARKRAGLQRRRLGSDLCTPLWRNIISQLQLGLSPQQYAGRIAMLDALHLPKGTHSKLFVSHPTIYQAVLDLPHSPDRGMLTRLLRQSTGGRRRRKASARYTGLQDITPIEQRSRQASERTEFGHWEGDLIKGSLNGSAMGTLVERVSRLTLLVPLRSASARDVHDGFRKALLALPSFARRSMTYDRGSEMALHKQLSKSLSMDIFFCPPYSPGARGTNENTNGLLRQYFPKGTDLSVHSASDIQRVQQLMNNRPRRILGYYTPLERFNALLAQALTLTA